ncbi:DUF676-domain-containing protein [Suhomyces tanzawaensis NRRL Y-17324]|uniref:DUF676-domain-containing protein n=1 Tax=Suhomyces tanzawaensis NRRL Y-17324 TaxID=984487 RepID=A0A1E4SLW6_9ASCO|nr:DUF676-domain-containing protein [Suhomyces tanzawaensis NRRL Y-17324]ODV80513.1 DUF676-domain-containing protein [Suhomyces tanzawaensis NRRL Y-17324]
MDHHLVVLVHGLWGNASHLEYIESQITSQISSQDKLTVYRTGTHSGYLTYDGVDVNGKRICDEILEQHARIVEQGDRVTKFSIVGYSLGGLISRYAIGILYSLGFFDKVVPVNFITFCSPHVGVLNPMSNYLSARMFNQFAPYFLAHSGSQLFLKDKIDTKPLLVWMADSSSYFFKALKLFRHRTLYSNVINDKRTCWFTAGISGTDPYHSMTNTDPSRLQLPFVDGYSPVVVDINKPMQFLESPLASLILPAGGVLNKIRILGNILLFTPLWTLYFVSSSILERIKLNKRVRHFFQDTSNSLVHLYESIEIEEDSLKKEASHEESLYETFGREITHQVTERQDTLVESVYGAIVEEAGEKESTSLNLTADQRFIIAQLNSLNWKKYPVLITGCKHTHAAAIVRYSDPGFEEGKVVVSHLVREGFIVS